jgi:predicted ATPase/DNA-binding SARP family transcriptional activator
VLELNFTLLGPVRAWRRQTELDLGSPQQRVVLTVLLLAEGRQVPVSTLARALWGGDPPKTAVGAVRTYVSRLRQVLMAGEGQEIIETAGSGYLLPTQPDAVDLSLFLRWTTEAKAARRAEEPTLAAGYLRDALDLWNGEPLAGLPGQYAESQRVRLTELRLAAVEDWLALEIELGGYVAAAVELRALVDAYPLRERFSELLMLALYRAGRQADALAVFDAARRVLGEELGINPGPALRDMHQRILHTDGSLIPAAEPGQWPLPASTPHVSERGDLEGAHSERLVGVDHDRLVLAPSGAPGRRLPVPMTVLLGRDQAIDEVTALVARADVRLVTLTGPGGVGKTRLAVAAGERLRDRFGTATVFAALDAVTDPGLVVAAIGQAARVDLSWADVPLETLAETFGGDAWLLIVDTLEHVTAAAPDLVELLARCPGMTILATSRTALGLRAEREYPVLPLPVPDDFACPPTRPGQLAACPAVALFVDRAQAVRPRFALAEQNQEAVAEICRRLGGLPLGIELAAARTRLLDPTTLLGLLSASLDALGAGAADLPERQRTLRATVEWSVNLLGDAERSLLETVTVFGGSWTLSAAAAVADLDLHQALSLLEALARHSLVYADDTGPEPRFRMMEAVREFTAERLAARSTAAEIRRRHARYYRELAEQADQPLRGAGHGEWLQRLEADGANLVIAVRWHLDHDRAPLPHMLRVLRLLGLGGTQGPGPFLAGSAAARSQCPGPSGADRAGCRNSRDRPVHR